MVQDDRDFVAKRKRLISSWPAVGIALIGLIVGFSLWLFFSSRWLIDPWFVMQQIQHDQISLTTLQTMALLLPVMFLVCLILLALVTLLAFAAFANEKRLIRIITASAGRL